jgi:hypothetical protein
MARDLLPYYNASAHGTGIEGVANYTNSLMGYWVVPTFLIVMNMLVIYVLNSKTDYKMGGILAYSGFIFFVLSWIAQTFTQFNQQIIFIFFVEMIVGIVVSYIENSK